MELNIVVRRLYRFRQHQAMRLFILSITALTSVQFFAQETSTELLPMSIDHQLRGQFYAASPSHEVYIGLGGWGASYNEYQPITEKHGYGKKVGIVVDTESQEEYRGGFMGLSVYLFNTTRDTAFFDAQDSRLELKMQAKDEKGTWRDIEYLPGSWCGNSYHTLYLPPNQYWDFVIPEFTGSMNTQIRIVGSYWPVYGEPEKIMLGSNSFFASINPGQFSNREGYQCQGIMDPYDE